MIKRLELLDLWRTVAILLMLFYHFYYDLGWFGYIPWSNVFSAGMRELPFFIGSSFILVSGISSRFSRNNLKRGYKVLGISIVISVVAYFAGMPIWFGVLHLLGSSMVIYGLFGRLIRRIPLRTAPVIFAALFVAAKLWTEATSPVTQKFLFPFGLTFEGFRSTDYYPLLPWLFMFLLGTSLGGIIKKHRSASWLNVRLPSFLTWPGRNSLAIYLVHQPLFYLIFNLLK